MANVDITNDGLVGLDYDPQGQSAYLQRSAWQFNTMDPPSSSTSSQRDAGARRPVSPLQTSGQGFEHTPALTSNLMNEWHFSQTFQQMPFGQDSTANPHQFGGLYNMPLQTSPTDFISTTQAPIGSGSLQLEESYMSLNTDVVPTFANWQDFQTDLSHLNRLNNFANTGAIPMPLNPQAIESSSPTDTYLDSRSLTSSSSNDGWTYLENHRHTFHDQNRCVDPSQTIHHHHHRAFSQSSESDFESNARQSFGSLGYVDISPNIHSPSTDSNTDFELLQAHCADSDSRPSTAVSPNTIAISPNPMAVSPSAMAITPSHAPVSPTTVTRPIPIKKASSPASSNNSVASPPSRLKSKKSPVAKSPIASKIEKSSNKKQSLTAKPETEKRVGKRKGPLRPDQRKQASEIRKLRACLRCKFLKKTCDKGEPCAGCQPAHARLWQVPCTRIDIKDIGYFMKDWKADYERHVSLGFSVGNIKGFSDSERTLFITHGYGHMLPVKAREVYVRDEKCFGLDWVEAWHHEEPLEYEISTAKLSAGMEGISTALLSDYLDRHIDGGFENFVDEYFEGTPFLTQMLKTAYRYYFRTQLPVIRKALKLILAYNLTLHITMVEGIPDEECLLGKIDDDTSKFFGRTMAPVMINFQIKCAMADMWRELQKDILEELSSLYSSVYSGDKLKNWPTIFMLASILLAVWEEMQFDCNYRVPDTAAVNKFCSDMETTPVGVIVGLFQAISQKLPSFSEWDSEKHHHLLNSNKDVCDTMTEVRENVVKHENYLRGRANCAFDRKDFDCLSNKFVSKLVIRAN